MRADDKRQAQRLDVGPDAVVAPGRIDDDDCPAAHQHAEKRCHVGRACCATGFRPGARRHRATRYDARARRPAPTTAIRRRTRSRAHPLAAARTSAMRRLRGWSSITAASVWAVIAGGSGRGRVRPDQADFPAWCRSGSAPSPHGRACPVTPRSPSRCPGSPTVVWPRSSPRSRGRAPRARSAATTSVTSPIRSAVSALTRSSLPINAIRSVSPRPTRRIRPIGSSAHTRPALTWESKNVASSRQMTTSDSLTK